MIKQKLVIIRNVLENIYGIKDKYQNLKLYRWQLKLIDL